ncbi:MAG TPA: SRPBCC family protein [Actinoplanes sp.]|nr:SRPBCC family protein [Actinoplanes sp.]
MSMVQQAIEVGAPLHTVYEQIARFENYPRFMAGVEQVIPMGSDRAHWVMDLDGHRREFDAQITELSVDERVSWSTTDGPLLSETITLRPMGETRTQVVAQLEADIAYLMPSDRHGQETLNRRLKDDLATFKGLVESGVMGGASSKQLSGRSSTIFGSGTRPGPASPASVAARIKRRPGSRQEQPHPGAGWDTGAGDPARLGTTADVTTAPGIHSVADLDDVLPPGRRIGGAGRISGGAAGSRSGAAPMGGHRPAKDAWGDGMINEEDRGSAHDF